MQKRFHHVFRWENFAQKIGRVTFLITRPIFCATSFESRIKADIFGRLFEGIKRLNLRNFSKRHAVLN